MKNRNNLDTFSKKFTKLVSDKGIFNHCLARYLNKITLMMEDQQEQVQSPNSRQTRLNSMNWSKSDNIAKEIALQFLEKHRLKLTLSTAVNESFSALSRKRNSSWVAEKLNIPVSSHQIADLIRLHSGKKKKNYNKKATNKFDDLENVRKGDKASSLVVGRPQRKRNGRNGLQNSNDSGLENSNGNGARSRSIESPSKKNQIKSRSASASSASTANNNLKHFSKDFNESSDNQSDYNSSPDRSKKESPVRTTKRGQNPKRTQSVGNNSPNKNKLGNKKNKRAGSTNPSVKDSLSMGSKSLTAPSASMSRDNSPPQRTNKRRPRARSDSSQQNSLDGDIHDILQMKQKGKSNNRNSSPLNSSLVSKDPPRKKNARKRKSKNNSPSSFADNSPSRKRNSNQKSVSFSTQSSSPERSSSPLNKNNSSTIKRRSANISNSPEFNRNSDCNSSPSKISPSRRSRPSTKSNSPESTLSFQEKFKDSPPHMKIKPNNKTSPRKTPEELPNTISVGIRSAIPPYIANQRDTFSTNSKATPKQPSKSNSPDSKASKKSVTKSSQKSYSKASQKSNSRGSEKFVTPISKKSKKYVSESSKKNNNINIHLNIHLAQDSDGQIITSPNIIEITDEDNQPRISVTSSPPQIKYTNPSGSNSFSGSSPPSANGRRKGRRGKPNYNDIEFGNESKKKVSKYHDPSSAFSNLSDYEYVPPTRFISRDIPTSTSEIDELPQSSDVNRFRDRHSSDHWNEASVQWNSRLDRSNPENDVYSETESNLTSTGTYYSSYHDFDSGSHYISKSEVYTQTEEADFEELIRQIKGVELEITAIEANIDSDTVTSYSCRFQLNDQFGSTRAIKSNHPFWQHKFKLISDDRENDILKINILNMKKEIAGVWLPVKEIPLINYFDTWLELSPKRKGSIHLVFSAREIF